MRAVAIVCARNEEIHIESALTDLIREGLNVVLIDHDSTDRTVERARAFLRRGLLGIERLAWKGTFALAEQLEAKWRVAEQVDHDWIVHADSDEWLSAPDTGQTLREGLAAADAAGYNCVNFNEFTFVPNPGEDVCVPDYRRRMRNYYFFENQYPRLLRAFKHRAGLDNRPGAGHLLAGDARRYPREFILRHYIALSEEHARRKYLERPFEPAELAQGWHLNRTLATAENLRLPSANRVSVLPHWASKEFDTGKRRDMPYWQWPSEDVPAAALCPV